MSNFNSIRNAISAANLTNDELHALNQLLITKMNHLRQLKNHEFLKGDAVSFRNSKTGETLSGKVVGKTAKNIKVEVMMAHGLTLWTVSASLLTKG